MQLSPPLPVCVCPPCPLWWARVFSLSSRMLLSYLRVSGYRLTPGYVCPNLPGGHTFYPILIKFCQMMMFDLLIIIFVNFVLLCMPSGINIIIINIIIIIIIRLFKID